MTFAAECMSRWNGLLPLTGCSWLSWDCRRMSGSAVEPNKGASAKYSKNIIFEKMKCLYFVRCATCLITPNPSKMSKHFVENSQSKNHLEMVGSQEECPGKTRHQQDFPGRHRGNSHFPVFVFWLRQMSCNNCCNYLPVPCQKAAFYLYTAHLASFVMQYRR